MLNILFSVDFSAKAELLSWDRYFCQCCVISKRKKKKEEENFLSDFYWSVNSFSSSERKKKKEEENF